MPLEKFTAELREGHKDCAVEVPFDPRERWSVTAQALWRGRRGFPVQAKVIDTRFETVIVGRSRKFWLLVPTAVTRLAAISVGDSAHFTIESTPVPHHSRQIVS